MSPNLTLLSLNVFCACEGLITSVPEAGGDLRPVDRVTVTSVKALTPTVTRPVDTVTARYCRNTHINIKNVKGRRDKN